MHVLGEDTTAAGGGIFSQIIGALTKVAPVALTSWATVEAAKRNPMYSPPQGVTSFGPYGQYQSGLTPQPGVSYSGQPYSLPMQAGMGSMALPLLLAGGAVVLFMALRR
jgi:hypothetical protein